MAVKPQSAFFEALGSDGVRAFEEVCEYARAAELLVIADAKRGDIGSTARAYASAFVEPRGDAPALADAITVNPYLGRDAIEPFLAACRRDGAGIFCLVKTSNAGGADVQDVRLSDGTLLWQHVAGLVQEWGEDLIGERGLSAVGAVVGATFPREVAEARRLLPQAVMLLPGVGAQGGRPADVAAAFTSGPASALVVRVAVDHLRATAAPTTTGAPPPAERPRTSRTRSGQPRAGEPVRGTGGAPARGHRRRARDPLRPAEQPGEAASRHDDRAAAARAPEEAHARRCDTCVWSTATASRRSRRAPIRPSPCSSDSIPA